MQRIAPRYQAASLAQKSLLLDQFVDLTGSTRKAAIRLLNHPPQGTGMIQRPRLPGYSRDVQQALFLAWKAARYICPKRLMPFLPFLIPVLEHHDHLQLTEEQRHQLLSMSSATAERFLRTQRKPTPHGISTTKAGTLLKHQIPIRTFAGWEDTQPGFLEADLVAHCGGHAEGSYVYTLTLTDVATGWTECLPLLARTADLVVKAVEHARLLFPFPILGIDTDNGSEFINEDLVAYCEREHLTFTRGRPEQKNDQCFVEERNREVVRRVVGYDRLTGEQAYQQLGELYRALRLYVNCFQPSMKLRSKQQEGNRARCVYDPAKTPLQRFLLSEGVSAAKQQELSEIAQSLDPLGLAEQVEQLQHAVWCCAVSSPSFRSNAASLLRFAVEPCLSEPFLMTEGTQEAGDPTSKTYPQPAARTPFLNWQRSSTNPFASEWERILAWVCAHPERSTRDLFEELQRLFPGRYTLSQYPALQRGVRKIRAHLRKHVEENWPIEIIHGPEPDAFASEPVSCQRPHQDDDGSPVARSSLLLLPEEKLSCPSLVATGKEETNVPPKASGSGELFSGPPDAGPPQTRHTSPPVTSGSDAMAVLTIDLAIEFFLQERKAAGRENKTLQWHQTALRSFQQRFAQHDKRFPQEITTAEVRNWLVHLRAKPSDTGMQRSASTVQNYARSARAFCHWSVRQGYLERTPFVRGTVPKAGYHPIQMMEPDIFEQLLQACGPLSELMDHATARNRAILWLLLETGLLLSEVCALRLVDVDREQGRLTIRGNGSKARQILLRDNALRSLHCYLDQYRPQRGEIVAKEASIFLSEIGQPLTTNAITLLLLRLSSRAGITDKQVKSSLFRDTFAVRYLQEGGDPKILQKLLGFTNKAALKRYQEAARSFPHRTPVPGIPEQVLS